MPELTEVVERPWAGRSNAVAMLFRTQQAGPVIRTPIFLVLFLAPVFVPQQLLAGWISAVAAVNPMTIILEAGRGFVSGEPNIGAFAHPGLTAGETAPAFTAGATRFGELRPAALDQLGEQALHHVSCVLAVAQDALCLAQERRRELLVRFQRFSRRFHARCRSRHSFRTRPRPGSSRGSAGVAVARTCNRPARQPAVTTCWSG